MSIRHNKSGGLSQRRVPTFEIISEELACVKKLISEQLAQAREPVGRWLESVNINGGKMFRPAMVLLAGGCCGKITGRHIRVAAIVEMIHNATLLHDDVIDEGQKRRGTPTINNLCGNETAVLLGDFLLSRVFRMCARLEPQVVDIIAATVARICEGELQQTIEKRNWQLSESEYIEIITEKSASFFKSCCYLGSLLGGADKTQMGLLADFGLNTGIAFQITDDLLDIIGDESRTGKTPGADVGANKPTLAVLHLLRTLDERKRAEIIKSLDFKSDESETTRPESCGAHADNRILAEMLRDYGSLDYARGLAQRFAAKAVSSLDSLDKGDAKETLLQIAGYAADRASLY